VIEVDRARTAIAACARHPRAGARLAAHAVAEACRIRQAGGDDVPRGDLNSAHADLVDAIETELVERLQDADEFVAQTVLEGDPPGLDPARDEQHLFVLDVHALDGSDALRKIERLGLAEGFRRVPAPALFPDDRRVEAFLDGRPDRERRSEVVALNDEVRSIADADLLDIREELVGGIPGEHVRQPRLYPDSEQGESARRLPLAGPGELLITELDATLCVRPLGVRS
jgi:hypothetical protein